jgi:hypothetical protein
MLSPPQEPQASMRWESLRIIQIYGTRASELDLGVAAGLQSCSGQTTSPSRWMKGLNIWLTGTTLPILFFAIEQGSGALGMIRVLVEASSSLRATTSPRQIPTLRFTVLQSDLDKENTTEIFKLLLALGANPHQIPSGMFLKLNELTLCIKVQRTHGLVGRQRFGGGHCNGG